MPDLITRKNNLSREISVFLIVSVRLCTFLTAVNGSSQVIVLAWLTFHLNFYRGVRSFSSQASLSCQGQNSSSFCSMWKEGNGIVFGRVNISVGEA